jgi:hypothetical protein
MTDRSIPMSRAASASRAQRWAEILPLHPFFFAAHSALALYAINANRLPFTDVLPLAGIVLLATLVFFLLFQTLTRRIVKAAILTTIAVVGIAQYRTLARMVTANIELPTLDAVFPIIWLIAIGGSLWIIGRSKNDLRPLGLGLNATAAAMLGFALYGIADFKLSDADGISAEIIDEMAKPPTATLAATGPRRDVYYLIFDRYANGDTLRDVYNFDNTPFLDELRGLGFYVAPDSASNYQRTAHSVASSLSLNYLDRLTELVGPESRSWLPLYAMLQDNAVGRFLKQQGYKFVQVGSWWNPTRHNPHADVNVNWHTTPELPRVFLMQTAFGQIAQRLGLTVFDDRAHQCERIHREFDALAELARDPQPTFVFAHVLLPHPPFVFGPDGECLSLETVTNRSRIENYTNQVRFANTKILEMIRAIRANSQIEPIIIIQSDEGPWPAPYAGDERFLGTDVTSVDWTRASRAELREKMRIINALYLPGPGASPFHPNMTPVNTFRIVFNRYFGTDLPLLPDENYVFIDDRHLYKFQRVTPIVQ